MNDRRPTPACGARAGARAHRRAGPPARACACCSARSVPLALFYFAWLLQPERVGHPALYGLLVAAELFNLVQALGFWWTCSGERARPPLRWRGGRRRRRRADPGLRRARRRSSSRRSPPRCAMTRRRRARAPARRRRSAGDGARWPRATARATSRRAERAGAKAGNINHALALTDAPYVARARLRPRAGARASSRRRSATWPTSASRSCRRRSTTPTRTTATSPRAAWSQQALFFGPIARGKDGHDAMFCCGTNVVFRREALERRRRLPAGLGDRGLRAVDRACTSAAGARATSPEVLARGLGPEDMASYVGQQQRWARGCLSARSAPCCARGCRCA